MFSAVFFLTLVVAYLVCFFCGLGKLFGSSDEDLDVVQTWMVKKLGCEEHKVRIASTKDIVICDKLLVDKTLRNTNAWDKEVSYTMLLDTSQKRHIAMQFYSFVHITALCLVTYSFMFILPLRTIMCVVILTSNCMDLKFELHTKNNRLGSSPKIFFQNRCHLSCIKT